MILRRGVIVNLIQNLVFEGKKSLEADKFLHI